MFEKSQANIEQNNIEFGIGFMTREQLDADLEKGYLDAISGHTKPTDEVFEELRKDFNI